MADVTIYHNPGCSTSRKVLALLRELGHAPLVVEYLRTPPDRATLTGLLGKLGMTPRQLLRRKGALPGELGLDVADDAAVLEAMLAHPVLIERPIVVTAMGARVGRPPDVVREILPG
jgi:arsenate reductase